MNNVTVKFHDLSGINIEVPEIKKSEIIQITAQDLKAMHMRFEGKTAKEIATETKYSLDTVYSYFAKGGKLHEAYLNYEKEMGDEIVITTKRILKQNIRKASQMLVAKIDSADEKVSLKASIEVLDRFFGKSVDVRANLTPDDTEDEGWSELVREIRKEAKDDRNKREAIEVGGGDTVIE